MAASLLEPSQRCFFCKHTSAEHRHPVFDERRPGKLRPDEHACNVDGCDCKCFAVVAVW